MWPNSQHCVTHISDLNECETGKHNCDANADCSNNDGSFSYKCKAGYSGDETELAVQVNMLATLMSKLICLTQKLLKITYTCKYS